MCHHCGGMILRKKVPCKCEGCGAEAVVVPNTRCQECLTYHGEKSTSKMKPLPPHAHDTVGDFLKATG